MRKIDHAIDVGVGIFKRSRARNTFGTVRFDIHTGAKLRIPNPGLAELLNLSQSQVDVITSAGKGQGLIYTGTNCVPFASRFPKNNNIYRCLTSNMAEIKQFEEEEKRRISQEKKAERKREAIA